MNDLVAPKDTDFPFFENKKEVRKEEPVSTYWKDHIHVFTVGYVVRPSTKMEYQDVHEHTYGGAGEFVRSHSKDHDVRSIAYKEYWGPSGLKNGKEDREWMHKKK